MRARYIVIIIMSLYLYSVNGFDTNAFLWPAGVSNMGPYALASVCSNVVVMTPNGSAPTELEPATHRYHHAAVVATASPCIFIAIAASGSDEGQDGQQCHMFASSNQGRTWGAPIVAIPSQSPWRTNINSAGVRYPLPRNATSFNGTNYMTFAVNQVTETNADSVYGAALLSCALHPDGTIGTVFRVSTNDYNPTNGYPVPQYDPVLGPPLLADSILHGVWGGTKSYGGGNIMYDPERPWIGFLDTNSNTFTEPNTFSADGGTNNYYRLWRVTGAYSGNVNLTNKAVQYSTDGGANWSLPVTTTIPDGHEPGNTSETAALRLSDGRFCFIGNPCYVDITNYRDPLFLAITGPNSIQITNVTSIMQDVGSYPVWDGNSKLGGAQYPGACQVGNYLYVGYSIHKESVGFSRVLIPGLADNNNDLTVTTANVGTANVGKMGMAQ